MKKIEVDRKVQEIKNQFQHQEIANQSQHEREEEKPSQHENTSVTTIQQNNQYKYYRFNINIDLKELAALSAQDPELAKDYLALQREQFNHAKDIDIHIFELEKKEQEARLEEFHYVKKYNFIGQLLAFITIIACLIMITLLVGIGKDIWAVPAVITAIGTVASQFINTKDKKDKLPPSSEVQQSYNNKNY
jgi:hypothetical protein